MAPDNCKIGAAHGSELGSSHAVVDQEERDSAATEPCQRLDVLGLRSVHITSIGQVA